MTVALLTIEELLDEVGKDSRKFLIVDSRPESEFLNGHIPGAIRIAWEEWCETAPVEAAPILHEPGYWGTLANTDDYIFERRLIDLGIKQSAPIVVYADSVRSKGREGRVAWMLLYLGAQAVYMLDHGWREWLKFGGPVETGNQMVAPPKGEFKVSPDHRRRVKHDDLFKNADLKNLPLMIDTRTAAEFHGDCYDYQPFKGKLPNSILFPFADLFATDGTFVDKERYLEITPKDILHAKKKVSYCEVGVRAATFALLHEIYTGEIIPVYDGSIIEWGWHRKSEHV